MSVLQYTKEQNGYTTAGAAVSRSSPPHLISVSEEASALKRQRERASSHRAESAEVTKTSVKAMVSQVGIGKVKGMEQVLMLSNPWRKSCLKSISRAALNSLLMWRVQIRKKKRPGTKELMRTPLDTDTHNMGPLRKRETANHM